MPQTQSLPPSGPPPGPQAGSPTGPGGPPTDGSKYKWVILCVTSLGTFMSGLNASSINIANPVLARVFSIGIDQVQWVTTVFLIVVSALMLLLGRIGDRIGGHKIYLGGLVVFLLGSLACGFADTFSLLLWSRALQAVGAAMMMATGMGIIATSFPLAQRGMAMGAGVLVVGLGNMCGPSIGGLILTHFDWNMIFFFNLPFGVFAFLLGLRFLRSPLPPAVNPPPLDIRGAVLLGVVISSLILCLSGGFAGSTWFIIVFIIGLPLFYILEKKHPAPLWDFTLLSNPRFSMGNLVAFLSYFANMSVFFLAPFFLEQIWRLPVGTVGLMMMISPLCMAVSAPLAGIVSDKIGSLRLMPVGLAVFCGGLVIMGTLGTTVSLLQLGAAFFLSGIGMGMLNTPNNSEIMTAAGKKNTGYAGGFVSTIRNLAFCCGAAASAGVFTSLQTFFGATHAADDAFLLAMRCIVAVAVVVTLVSLALCLWLKGQTKTE